MKSLRTIPWVLTGSRVQVATNATPALDRRACLEKRAFHSLHAQAAPALCTVNRIFLLGSCCLRGSGATTVFGTGIGLIFAASARSVAIALIGNFVLPVSRPHHQE
jgi:hypothetical protein